MFLGAGQTSDYTGAAALLSSLPAAKVLRAEPGCNPDDTVPAAEEFAKMRLDVAAE